MTLVSSIIVNAYRESNLTGVGRSLTSNQETEGLSLLNGLIPATIGQEVGQELYDINVGGQYDWPIWDYAPENVRLVLNSGAPQTLYLHPKPYDGQRLAVADAGQTLASSNLTLNGNGRQIEGAATLVLDTDGLCAQWLYRGDLGNWVRIEGLELTDAMPLPIEFDDYFAILLAMRLNPRHGRELASSSAVWLERQSNALQARYRRPRDVQDWGSLGLLGQRRTWDTGFGPRWRGW